MPSSSSTLNAIGQIMATLLPFFGKDDEDPKSRMKRQSLHLSIIAGLLDQLHDLILTRDLVRWLERLAEQPEIECRHRNGAWRPIGDILDAFHDAITPTFVEIVTEFSRRNYLKKECDEVLTSFNRLQEQLVDIRTAILTITKKHPLCEGCDLIHPLSFEYGLITVEQYAGYQ